MSFIAILAAAAVLGVAIYRNKGHNYTTVNSGDSAPIISPKDAAPRPSAEIKMGHLIPENPSKEVPKTPTVETSKIESPKADPEIPKINATPQPPAQPEKLFGPNSAVVYAMGDLLTVPIEDRPYIRYLSLYNVPTARRSEMAALVSFMVNSLSTRKKMYIPQFVGASEQTLIRVDIRHYEWKKEAWEKLGEKGSGPRPFPEPYFHIIEEIPVLKKVKVKKLVKVKKGGGYDQFNRPIPVKEVEEEREVEETVAGKREFKVSYNNIPWLDTVGITNLAKQTESNFPIFRADWFISNASIPPAYYDFLKLGNNTKDFENLVFADDKLATKARSQDKAVVVTSMVARNNRTLTRSPTFTGGYYWISHDTLKSVDDRNYMHFLLDENFDATEDIATLSNGLQAYFLTDGKGNRLDFANPDIAIDNISSDRLVRTGRSCMICHAEGIRPLQDEVRALTKRLQNREQVQLLITRKEDAYRIEDLFSSDLDEQIIKDQNLYRAAVARATGLQSEVISKLLNDTYTGYIEHLLSMDDICREVGMDINELNTYIKASKDNLVLGLIKSPIRPVRRDQWEASFQRFMILIMARKQGLDHADPYPPGPLIPAPIHKQ